MVKVYPSQLDWTEGIANVAENSSHCWRFILLSQGIRPDINPIYSQIGAINEQEHYNALDAIGEAYQVEVPFKFEESGVTVSGRVDVLKVVEHSIKPTGIDECKATFSKSTFDKAPKDTHLYQLCLYLGHFELQQGNLVYGYMQKAADDSLVRTAVNVVPVEIKDDGKVFVAKRETGYNIDQVMYPVLGLGEVLKTGKIPDRPLTRSWAPACKYCPMAAACDDYDSGTLDSDSLKAVAKKVIPNAPQSEPKITKVKKNGKV
jgi:hypothetical protein